jgi:apolipoprotein N-acyltransferase
VMFTPDRWFEYDKRHLVPGLEARYHAGAADAVIQTPQGPFGMAICKDLDFLELGRAYSRAGIGVLLVPAWDFTTDGWLHSRMAILRGVEGGYAIVRAAARGRLTVSDAEGRVVAEESSDALPQAMLTADVRLGAGRTFYGRMGDWFAWLCVAAALVLLALSLNPD